MDKIRWGILGCADIVERRTIDAFCEVENGYLYAIASRGKSARLERVLARTAPEKVYSHYDELLGDPNVDAVYLPLPNSLHAQWAIRSANAKKHVLVEKPIATSVSEFDSIAEAARENKVIVMEAFACMQSPLYPTIRGLISAGVVGEVRLVESTFYYAMQSMQSNINASPELAGGSINDVGCYNLLTIRQLTGREPVAIKAMATYLPTGVDASATAVLDMGEGITGLSKCSMVTASRRDIYVCGSEGHINFPKTPNTWGDLALTIATRAEKKRIVLHTKNTYALELMQFARCIQGLEAPAMPLSESRKNVRALEMLHDAIKSEKGANKPCPSLTSNL